MRVSIITVCLNAANTICLALDSVAAQRGVECEHIVIDGGSTDGTVELVKTRDSRLATLVSEPDSGIYDAINKGLKLATGDVIGILNADDSLAHENVITRVLETLSDEGLDGCYSDLLYFDKDNSDEIVRYFRSNQYQTGTACFGWMPPHPTIYLKKPAIERLGNYRVDVGPQADLEYCARMLEIERMSLQYVPEVWVRMRTGGVTNNRIRDIVRGNWGSYVALKELGLAPNAIIFFFQKFKYRLPTYLHPFSFFVHTLNLRFKNFIKRSS